MNEATLTADRFGISENAYSFDGLSSFISVNESISLKPTNSISISLFCYIDSTNSNCFIGIINKYLNPDPSYSSYQIITGNGGLGQTRDAGITIRTNNIYMCSGVTGVSYLNQWAHIVGTHDGNTIKCYKNGILV